jgi:hypothetical protein
MAPHEAVKPMSPFAPEQQGILRVVIEGLRDEAQQQAVAVEQRLLMYMKAVTNVLVERHV